MGLKGACLFAPNPQPGHFRFNCGSYETNRGSNYVSYPKKYNHRGIICLAGGFSDS
jgi:hypothetical protein